LSPDSTRTVSRTEASTQMMTNNETIEMDKKIATPEMNARYSEKKRGKMPSISRELPDVFRVKSKNEDRTSYAGDENTNLKIADILASPKFHAGARKLKPGFGEGFKYEAMKLLK
jgi:hypothetical protein